MASPARTSSAPKMFPSAVEKALANIASALWSVKARQKISASALELRHQLFRQLQLDLGVAAKFPKCAKYPRQTERRSVLHHRRPGRVAEFVRLGISVVYLAEAVDEFGVERVLTGKDPAIGDRVSQHVGRQTALFRDDTEKLVVSLHHETLDQLLF